MCSISFPLKLYQATAPLLRPFPNTLQLIASLSSKSWISLHYRLVFISRYKMKNSFSLEDNKISLILQWHILWNTYQSWARYNDRPISNSAVHGFYTSVFFWLSCYQFASPTTNLSMCISTVWLKIQFLIIAVKRFADGSFFD